MLIRTMRPFGHFAPDPTISSNNTPTEHGQSPQIANNPMDIRAMLNPSVGAPECCNNLDAEQERKYHLPSVMVEPCEFTPHQTTLAFHRRAGNSSPLQSPHSPCYEPQAFTPTFNHGLPTPPPSSPQHFHQSQPDQHTQGNLTAGPSHQHHSSWKSHTTLPPRKRLDSINQYQDPHWNIPVEVHHIRISHSRSRTTPSRRSLHGISKASKRKRLGPHSNKAYTQEQVHWMRYFSEDRGYTWPQVHACFYQEWPGEARDSVACITSRYYRSNLLARLDDNGEPTLDQTGKLVMIPAKVRERATEEGKDKPFLFLDLHPEWALVYDWVTPEHKARAMRVLQILENPSEDNEGKSQKYRNYQRAQRILDGQNKDLVMRLARLNL
ncbi:hypothetical protein N431DRAFT_428810 [Stipitochalara longipes BDJ]|nr:hypothetical protein N431DRAFT_428810 [Stipitochalara longipes BDJ]